jgi:hypothetical protein
MRKIRIFLYWFCTWLPVIKTVTSCPAPHSTKNRHCCRGLRRLGRNAWRSGEGWPPGATPRGAASWRASAASPARCCVLCVTGGARGALARDSSYAGEAGRGAWRQGRGRQACGAETQADRPRSRDGARARCSRASGVLLQALRSKSPVGGLIYPGDFGPSPMDWSEVRALLSVCARKPTCRTRCGYF